MNQYFYNGSFICFDRLSFQVQNEKNQTPFTLNKLNTVHNGVFTYQPNNCDSIMNTAKAKSKCKDDQEYLMDKDSWSLVFEELFLDYDDNLDKQILECHTLPYLHSDAFCKRTLQHRYTFVWFSEEIFSIFHISDFIGRMSKKNNRYWLKTIDFFETAGKNTKKLLKAHSHMLSFTPLGATTPTLSRLETSAQKKHFV